MPAMTKRVNVRTTVAVRTINPPISGTKTNIIMSTNDILKCLCRRAIVEEILPNGKTIRLNMNNYYLDNGAGLDAYNTTPETKVETKIEDKPEVKNVNANIVSSNDITPVDEEPIVEDSIPEAHEEVVETTEVEPVVEKSEAEEVIQEDSIPEEIVPYVDEEPKQENNYNNHKKNKKK